MTTISQGAAPTAAAPRVPDGTSRRRAGRRRAGRTAAYHLAIWVLGIIMLYPGLWLLLSAFRPSNQIVGETGLIPDDTTLDNFKTVFEGIGGVSFWTFFMNSVYLGVGSAVGICLSCSVTAYAFSRIEFPGRGLFFTIMIGTLMLPFHVLIIPQFIMFNEIGWTDTYWPLLIGKFLAADAFFVFLMTQFMRTVPKSLDESARIDGAGHLRIYWSIMLPLMRPVLATASIFAFIWSWNDFMGPLIYLRSPDKYPLPMMLRQYADQTSTSDYGAQMAAALLALAPVIVFFVLFQRYIVEGVSTQGLRG
ncbi:carbohydrate ABC transporter permease [Streptomyces hoynatensis]|uniref:Carbohydrate ABC transporter permease n=1 Tax=Streptomyces hoynatensis TaxID=1141874 RepID=A0A3A9Z3D1_9ACTN|nr:carbohydrate ABC transporter permease [Streptomyces hoynatensis]RKN42334.1 carbohydrate ABC transporter permease [Streptomyces hoynatensis]